MTKPATFLNFNPTQGVYAATHRDIQACVCGDVLEFVESVYNQEPACVSVDDAKAMSDAICDGRALLEYFPNVDPFDPDMQEVIETIHYLLTE
jgi:hypothetical protein